MDAKVIVFFTIVGAALAGIPRQKGKQGLFFFLKVELMVGSALWITELLKNFYLP